MDTGAVVVMRYVTTDLQTKNRFASRAPHCLPKKFTAMLPSRRMTRYVTTNFHENDSSV